MSMAMFPLDKIKQEFELILMSYASRQIGFLSNAIMYVLMPTEAGLRTFKHQSALLFCLSVLQNNQAVEQLKDAMVHRTLSQASNFSDNVKSVEVAIPPRSESGLNELDKTPSMYGGLFVGSDYIEDLCVFADKVHQEIQSVKKIRKNHSAGNYDGILFAMSRSINFMLNIRTKMMEFLLMDAQDNCNKKTEIIELLIYYLSVYAYDRALLMFSNQKCSINPEFFINKKSWKVSDDTSFKVGKTLNNLLLTLIKNYKLQPQSPQQIADAITLIEQQFTTMYYVEDRFKLQLEHLKGWSMQNKLVGKGEDARLEFNEEAEFMLDAISDIVDGVEGLDELSGVGGSENISDYEESSASVKQQVVDIKLLLSPDLCSTGENTPFLWMKNCAKNSIHGDEDYEPYAPPPPATPVYTV